MSSDTTVALLKSVNDRLLSYMDNAGRKLTDYVDDITPRLFVRITPDNVSYPYVVIRIADAETDTEYSNLRSIIRVEARCVHRKDDGTVEQMADLAEEALLTWQESSAALGVTFGNMSHRQSVEPDTDAPNRDLAEVMIAVTCVSWSKRLTAIAT